MQHGDARVSLHVIARSISQPVWERLREEPFTGRVLAVFERACNLITPDSSLVALVLPQVGDGPLNIVVEGKPGDLAVESGTSAWLEGRRLRVGGLEVALEKAVVWEPRPDWDSLRAHREAFTDRLPLLQALALHHTPAGSLLVLTSDQGQAGSPTHLAKVSSFGSASDTLFAVARKAAEALVAGWEGDPVRLQAGAAQLAGLGGGLTPAGDDFLAGVMLWGWLAHPTPRTLCRLLYEAAAPRTTTLSAAFLRAAARGEFSAPWHRLLDALRGGAEVSELDQAVQEVLSHGSTSGADTLAGLLWIAK